MTCGVHLHTVGEGSVAYREGGAENPRRGVPQLMRAAPDSMLVSFLAEPRPIPTPLASPSQAGQGVYFSLSTIQQSLEHELPLLSTPSQRTPRRREDATALTLRSQAPIRLLLALFTAMRLQLLVSDSSFSARRALSFLSIRGLTIRDFNAVWPKRRRAMTGA